MQTKFVIAEFFKPFVRVLDVLFSSVVVGPLVVCYWITTWKIFDLFIKPDDPRLSATISFIIGFTGQLIFVFYQNEIRKSFKFENHKFINFVVSKVYILLFAQTCISFWRGVWNFVDIVSSSNTLLLSMNAIQNLLLMVISKTLRNSISAPFVVESDKINEDFTIKTYFKRVVS